MSKQENQLKFEDFDPFLVAWTEEQQIRLFRMAQDYEVRSFSTANYKFGLSQYKPGQFRFLVTNKNTNQKVEEFDATPDKVAEYLKNFKKL